LTTGRQKAQSVKIGEEGPKEGKLLKLYVNRRNTWGDFSAGIMVAFRRWGDVVRR